MGDPLVDPAGVPPLGVVVRSNTGPSYKPRGTACISAICHQREEDSDTSLSPGNILLQPSPSSQCPCTPLTLPCTISPAALRPGTAPLPCKVCRASATGCHVDEVDAAQMGEEKAILANLLILNSISLQTPAAAGQDEERHYHC